MSLWRQLWRLACLHPWVWATVPLCVTTTACNVLWGVDELSFATPAFGGQGPGGSGGDGAGGAGGSGGAAGGGGGVVDCSGEFGEPEEVLSLPNATLGSPAITAQQRELYYVSTVASTPQIRRTTRSGSEPFGAGEDVPELTALCSSPADLFGFDVTADGLRAYVSCATINSDIVVMLAVRTVAGETPFIAVGPLGSAGGSPGISANELVVYTTGKAAVAPPLQAERGSLNDVFGLAVDVPGLAGLPLRTPGPTPDGLGLFGFLLAGPQLGYVARSDSQDPFGPFTPVVTTLFIAGAPDVSADCRAVYFVGNEPGGQDASVIYVMER